MPWYSAPPDHLQRVAEKTATLPLGLLLYNSIKNEPISVIFGRQNPEDIRRWFLYTCPPHSKNVTALPCEMRNVSRLIKVT